MSDVSRRKFLGAGATLGVGLAACNASGSPLPESRPTAAPTPPAAPPQAGSGPYQPQFFNPEEMAFLAAAADRFIPADELSPSGSDLGVPQYIDRQMAGPYGMAARWYMQGPFKKGLPGQGYQSKRTPAELLRDGIRAVDRTVGANGNVKAFADLDGAHQDEILRALEGRKYDLPEVDGKLFFTFLHQLAVEGFLADPMYGGNRDMAGWTMIGFPGARANYHDWPEKTDQPYPYPPVSIMAGGA